jgi:GNAT superfamily N-acetyltransferase
MGHVSISIIIRPARLREYKAAGSIAAETYFPTALTAFLSPGRIEYYSHYERSFQKMALSRMLDPATRSLVACESHRPERPIGCIHFKRLGDDEGAKAYVRQKESMLLWLGRWLAWAWFLLITAIVGQKAEDPEALRLFGMWSEDGNMAYWTSHKERRNRLHVLSFVVLKQYQGMGVGKKLLAEVMKRAVQENVIIGLEASPEGEPMVSSLHPGASVCLNSGGILILETYFTGRRDSPLGYLYSQLVETADSLNSIGRLDLTFWDGSR